MKLRQKLAMVLAAAMVVTAVPVTTMAASTNKFNKTVSIVADEKITTDSGVFLTVKYDAASAAELGTTGKDVFFVNATDFEFDEDLYDAQDFTQETNATVEWLSKSQLKVTVVGAQAATEVKVPVVGTPKKGNPAITVDGEDSLVTSGKYALTGEVVTNKVLSAKAGDAKNISVEGFGTIADITIEEKVANQLGGKTVTITLPNSSDLVFNNKYKDGADVTVEGKRGLADDSVAKTVTASYFVDEKGNKDDKKLTITFPKYATGTRGEIVLKGIEVQAEDKKEDCDTGEVKVTVASKDVMDDTKLVVANVAEFGVALTVKETKELVAGQGTEKVKVKVKENAVDSLSSKRDIYFTIEEGRFIELSEDAKKDGFSFTNDDKDEIVLDLEAKKDGKPVFKENELNEFEFEVEIAAKATHKGPVVIKAESRNFEEDLKVEVATVTPAVKIEAKPLTVKAGLKDQIGGEIIITETAEERLAKNKTIVITADEFKGFGIEDAKVEVTEGDIEIKSEVKNDELIITVKRSSDEASTIKISEIEVTTDRTIPEGTFDVKVGGDAIADLNKEVKQTGNDKEVSERYDDAIVLEDFIVVSTKNTEDLPTAAVKREVVLAIGSADYTVNGEAKTGVAAPYVEAGRTMIPLRLVSEEFGAVVDFGTLNGVGTVTITKEGQVIQFQNGSNIMNQNGIAVPMDAKTVITNGTTYVPFRYLANALGTAFTWDAETQTIVFKN